MQGMRLLTKKELHDLIDEEFKDYRDDDPIASFFTCSGRYQRTEQQCLMFHKETKIIV